MRTMKINRHWLGRIVLALILVLTLMSVAFAAGESGDQKRVTTPERAREIGSDDIVVGRPITQADDPVAAYRRCVAAFVG